jgi:hypothetical protein
MSKLEKMQRFVPGLYRPQSNEVNRGLLWAMAGEDDLVVQAIQDAKEQLFVSSAQLQFLDALGSNVGVFRPTAFKLADEQFRNLIPALSFSPKQVRPTIIKVLNVFFGVGNPKVQVFEVNPNEIVIQIPSSVPALRRDLRGSMHFKVYSGKILSVDNLAKTMQIDMYGNGIKVLQVDELAGCKFGQELLVANIVGNAAGSSNVTIQFTASDNLSGFQVGETFVMNNPVYPGAYLCDPRRAYSVTMKRGTIGQTITPGGIAPTIVMQDSSGIPDALGYVAFNFGFENEEGPVKYFSRPNNTTLQLDPSYIFTKQHSIGEVVNVVVTPYQTSDISGFDYRPYLVGVTAARVLAQQIVQSVLAAGIVIRWIVKEPSCED